MKKVFPEETIIGQSIVTFRANKRRTKELSIRFSSLGAMGGFDQSRFGGTMGFSLTGAA